MEIELESIDACYKYIYIKKIKNKTKTSVWNIHNNKSHDVLGGIAWYPPWRQYCLYAKETAVFNASCLNDIQDFIRQAMEERKINKAFIT